MVPLGHDLAAARSRAGADINQVVSESNRVIVVFHNDQGVAFILQRRQKPKQRLVIFRMQSDSGFVQDVTDALQV